MLQYIYIVISDFIFLCLKINMALDGTPVQWPTQDMVNIHLSLFSVTKDTLLSLSPNRINVGFFVVWW